MLSPTDQAALVAEVTDAPGGPLQAAVAALAIAYDGKDRVVRGLERLYVKRSLLDIRLGPLASDVQVVSEDEREYREQRFAMFSALRVTCQADIDRLERKARAVRGGASMAIVATAPVAPPLPCPYPDANSPAYSGSPYVRNWPDGRLP